MILRAALIALGAISGLLTLFLLVLLAIPEPSRSSGQGAPVAGHFELIDTAGKEVTDHDFVGKPALWLYGFTRCSRTCSQGLAEIASLIRQLGADGYEITAVFVTIDPERDTPHILKEYLSTFDSRIIGLTGRVEQVNQLAESRGISTAKVPVEGPDYTFSHSSTIYVTGATGAPLGTLNQEDPLDFKLETVRRLIRLASNRLGTR